MLVISSSGLRCLRVRLLLPPLFLPPLLLPSRRCRPRHHPCGDDAGDDASRHPRCPRRSHRSRRSHRTGRRRCRCRRPRACGDGGHHDDDGGGRHPLRRCHRHRSPARRCPRPRTCRPRKRSQRPGGRRPCRLGRPCPGCRPDRSWPCPCPCPEPCSGPCPDRRRPGSPGSQSRRRARSGSSSVCLAVVFFAARFRGADVGSGALKSTAGAAGAARAVGAGLVGAGLVGAGVRFGGLSSGLLGGGGLLRAGLLLGLLGCLAGGVGVGYGGLGGLLGGLLRSGLLGGGLGGLLGCCLLRRAVGRRVSCWASCWVGLSAGGGAPDPESPSLEVLVSDGWSLSSTGELLVHVARVRPWRGAGREYGAARIRCGVLQSLRSAATPSAPSRRGMVRGTNRGRRAVHASEAVTFIGQPRRGRVSMDHPPCRSQDPMAPAPIAAGRRR